MSIQTLGFMLTALASLDKPAFLERCSDTFASVAMPQFESMSGRVAPHLRSGYKVVHFGDLKRRGGGMSVFKIEFADGADDLIAMISERSGKVTGMVFK